MPRAHWALYEGLASHEEINKDLFSFVLREIFACQRGLIPTRDGFTSIITDVKQTGPYVLGKKILDQVVVVLQERRATLDFISDLEDQCRGKKYFGISEDECAFFRGEVARYLPPDFLNTMTADKLMQIPRYLKGLTIRLERKLQDPGKDNARLKEITPFLDWLAEVRKMEGIPPEVEEELDYFSTMIEELRISLFAQELKTLFPISGKRLKKKQQEITILLP